MHRYLPGLAMPTWPLLSNLAFMKEFFASCEALKPKGHVELINFIKRTCENGKNFNFVESLIKESFSMDFLVSFYALDFCFNDSEPKCRKLIIEAIKSSSLPSKLIKMLLSDVLVAKMTKDEFLDVFGSVCDEELKFKMLKKLHKNSFSEAIVSHLISGNPYNIPHDKLKKLMAFSSLDAFLNESANLESGHECNNFNTFMKYSSDLAIAYLEKRLSSTKAHKYLSCWSNFSTNGTKLDSKVLLQLYCLFEEYPPYVIDSKKAASEFNTESLETLCIFSIPCLYLPPAPQGDISPIVEHFIKPENWLKRAFGKFFLCNIQNIYVNWNICKSQKEQIVNAILSNLSENYNYSTKSIELEKVSANLIQKACWTEAFKVIIDTPQAVPTTECFELILRRFQSIISSNLNQLHALNSTNDPIMATESIQGSFLENVIQPNLMAVMKFIDGYSRTKGANFATWIKNKPQENLYKLSKLVQINEKIIRYLESVFIVLIEDSKKYFNESGIYFKHQKMITTFAESMNSLFLNMKNTALFTNFHLPLKNYKLKSTSYYEHSAIIELSNWIDEELIKKDILRTWINSWIPVYYSCIENDLSVSLVSSPLERDTFNCYSEFFLKFKKNILNIDTFIGVVLKPALAVLQRLDAAVFNTSVSSRFSYIRRYEYMELFGDLIKSAVPIYVYYNENLDELFKAKLICSSIYRSSTCSPSLSFEEASINDLIENIEFIASGVKGLKPYERIPEKYFSNEFVQKLAQKFVSILKVTTEVSKDPKSNFTNYKKSILGSEMHSFVYQLSAAICEQEPELEEVMEKAIQKGQSVFEDCILFNLPIDGKIVKKFVTKKLEKLDDFEDKIAFYEQLYGAAVKQNFTMKDNTVDMLLNISSIIQPKIARVNWKFKMIDHPFTTSAILSLYLAKNNLKTPFFNLKHSEQVIQHLRKIWNDRWTAESQAYLDQIQVFCNALEPFINQQLLKFKKYEILSEEISQFHFDREAYEIYQFWADFCFELRFDAQIKTQGSIIAQTTPLDSGSFCNLLKLLIKEKKSYNKTILNRKIDLKLFEWIEDRYKMLLNKFYPNLKLNCAADSNHEYPVKLVEMIESALILDIMTPYVLELFDTLIAVCRAEKTANSSSSLQNTKAAKLFARLIKSLNSKNSDDSIAVSFPSRKTNEHLFERDDKELFIEFYKKYISFCEEFGSNCSPATVDGTISEFPTVPYYFARHQLTQFLEPSKTCDEIKLEFYRAAIKICPSFIRLPFPDICGRLMREDPMFLLETVQSGNPRLLIDGIFVSSHIKYFVIPYTSGHLSKDISNESLTKLGDYFIGILTNRNVSRQDRLSSVKWLAGSILSLNQIFPHLYAKLCHDSKIDENEEGKCADPVESEIKLALCKILYNSPIEHMPQALEILFSDLISNDSNIFLQVIVGLNDKYCGSKSSSKFSQLIRPYIDPKLENNKRRWMSTFKIALQKALIKLSTSIDNGSLLNDFWNMKNEFNANFNGQVIKCALEIFANNSNETEQTEMCFRIISEALKEKSEHVNYVDLLDSILSVGPFSSHIFSSKFQIYLLDGPTSSSLSIRNLNNCIKYFDLVAKEVILENNNFNSELVEEKKIIEAFHLFIYSWFKFKEIDLSHDDCIIRCIMKFVNHFVFNEVSESPHEKLYIYNLIPIISKFVGEIYKTSQVDYCRIVVEHFKSLLLSVQNPSESKYDFKTISSNLQKLLILTDKIIPRLGVVDLSQFSIQNTHELAQVHKLYTNLYSKLDSE